MQSVKGKQKISPAFVQICLALHIYKSNNVTLKAPITTMSSALSSAGYFKSHFCKQCGPRSDCPFRSSLIWVHTLCLYAKIGLKSLQEYSADDVNRQQMSDAGFLGALGVKIAQEQNIATVNSQFVKISALKFGIIFSYTGKNKDTARL